jgi:hypothetical protein
MATVEEFASITKKVIARDGFEDYLPTALYPRRRHLVVLEGVPDGADLEPIVMKWAIKDAIGDEEFLVAFKVGPNKFKVIRRYSGAQEEKVFNAVDDDA